MIAAGRRAGPVNILLVEDNPGDVDLFRESISEEAIRVEFTVANDGVEALRYLRQRRQAGAVLPAIVILDLNLPRKDGRQVLAEVRGDEELRSLPIVVLTSSEAPDDIANSYRLGASCYVTKPVDLDRFRKVVRSIEDFWLSIAVLPELLQGGGGREGKAGAR